MIEDYLEDIPEMVVEAEKFYRDKKGKFTISRIFWEYNPMRQDVEFTFYYTLWLKKSPGFLRMKADFRCLELPEDFHDAIEAAVQEEIDYNISFWNNYAYDED